MTKVIATKVYSAPVSGVIPPSSIVQGILINSLNYVLSSQFGIIYMNRANLNPVWCQSFPGSTQKYMTIHFDLDKVYFMGVNGTSTTIGALHCINGNLLFALSIPFAGSPKFDSQKIFQFGDT